jgi:hypothetical protein
VVGIFCFFAIYLAPFIHKRELQKSVVKTAGLTILSLVASAHDTLLSGVILDILESARNISL